LPSGDSGKAGSGPPAALIAVVTAVLVIRLLIGSQVHLTEDEAYYRLWSLAPAFGYYDHPPMIAWWVWAGRHLVGDTPLGVRLAPILAGAITSLLVFDLARLAGAGRALAGRAGIWFNAMPLVALGGVLAVPDAPASFFWVATLWCCWHAARASSNAWWAAAGVAAGLALLSKYSALFLAPGVLIWLATGAERRRELHRPGPWLAGAIAAALFSLNVIWNADHHWLTFHKQFGRLSPSGFAPAHLLAFLLEQTVLLNPLIAVFAGTAVFVRARPGGARVGLSLFVATAIPFGAYLLFHGLHDRVEAHWPAPLYPGIAICAAVGAERLNDRAFWRRLAKMAPQLGFGVCAVVLAYAALPASAVGRADLALPVRGWPKFASRLQDLAVQNGAAWIGTTSYGLAAQLTTEPFLSAPIMQLAERDRWTSVSTGPQADTALSGLVTDLPRRASKVALGRCFGKVESLGLLVRGDPGGAGQPYAVFRVSDPKSDLLLYGC
jgi:4-amino-4-deoxy-L-arabinose transferase-like glycosyltransferase